ncbi:hypothetical protein C1S70_31595 (plasmid) [Azospirillum argentinense]|uniref:Uncharacterized protein n=1 Tax=Azospirillum argentinense TaxID=2970906 RepID=A0A2K1FR32_9PROT|nr:hypothetical protein C1S70_31595 [Azospirillum argentinense]
MARRATQPAASPRRSTGRPRRRQWTRTWRMSWRILLWWEVGCGQWVPPPRPSPAHARGGRTKSPPLRSGGGLGRGQSPAAP